MFQDTFKGVSGKVHECFKEVSWKFQRCFKKVVRVFQVRLKAASISFKGISMVLKKV